MLTFISEVSAFLHDALAQAIKTSIASLPQSAYPISASTFYTTHIQPARPIHIADAATPVDIKHSTFKSLTAFLKHYEKQGVLRLKDLRGDVHITGVNANHETVRSQPIHRTIGELESERRKQKERDEKREQQQVARGKQTVVIELWKPHQSSLKLFQEAKLEYVWPFFDYYRSHIPFFPSSTSLLYTLSDLREAIKKYVAEHDMINKTEQQLINADSDLILRNALWPQTGKNPPPIPEFAKREELVTVLCTRMQPWYRLEPGNGGEPITK